MLKRRLLPWELLFPALLDVSVSYQGCNRTTYEEITQTATDFFDLVLHARCSFWDVIVFLILKYAQNGGNESQLPQEMDD